MVFADTGAACPPDHFAELSKLHKHAVPHPVRCKYIRSELELTNDGFAGVGTFSRQQGHRGVWCIPLSLTRVLVSSFPPGGGRPPSKGGSYRLPYRPNQPQGSRGLAAVHSLPPSLSLPPLCLRSPGPGVETESETQVIREMLATGFVEKFKIGITFQPARRWTNPKYGYQVLGYTTMVICYASESSDVIAEMEEGLIALYRVFDRSGQYVQKDRRDGDVRCANRAPGGESAHHGHSPFFLYVVAKIKRLPHHIILCHGWCHVK